MNNILVAVDIGLSGAISFFDTVSNELLSVYDMPTIKVRNKAGKEKSVLDLDRLKFFLEIPKEHNDTAMVIYEDVHAFPGQGVTSVGTLLEQKGAIRGMCKVLGYDEYPITPQVWQKFFQIIPPKDLKGKEKRKKWLKAKSLEVARLEFPLLADTKLNKATNHGRSDSMLIGKWYLETMGTTSPEVEEV